MPEKRELRLRNGLQVKYLGVLRAYRGDIGVIESSRKPFPSTCPTLYDYIISMGNGNKLHAYAGDVAVQPNQSNPIAE